MAKKQNDEFHVVRGFKSSKGSGKIVRNSNDEYFLEIKKYVLGFTVRKKIVKYPSYDAAEDALNELQTDQNFW